MNYKGAAIYYGGALAIGAGVAVSITISAWGAVLCALGAALVYDAVL